MRQSRRRIVTAVLAMLVAIGGWLALLGARLERAPELVRAAGWQTRVWYPLENQVSAPCEIPAGQQFRLVLGCLGDATQEHGVSFSLGPTQLGPHSDHQSQPKINSFARHVGQRTIQKGELAPSSTPHVGTHRPLVAPREFFLHVTDGRLDDPKQYARITASNLSAGTRVRIFVDQQLAQGEVSPSRIDDLLSMLETDVLPRVEAQFGPLCDVDGDGCLSVVLTPWLSRLQGGRTSIGGMVRSSDFQRDMSPPLGNRTDMLLLNSAFPSGAALRDLLSHEVAHAACISQRLSRKTGSLRDEEDWISEALAHLAEPGWSNLDQRLKVFLDDPMRYPLVVQDYYRAGLWRNPGCRGATYLFSRWCVGSGESTLIRELARSKERGTRNFERAMGRRFDDLFRAWTLSIAGGDEFDAPDLHGVLRRIGSAGVQPLVCHAGLSDRSLQIRGTAFAVVDLLMDESSPRTLRITGDSRVKWQYSICRWPDDSRRHPENRTLAAIKR